MADLNYVNHTRIIRKEPTITE